MFFVVVFLLRHLTVAKYFLSQVHCPIKHIIHSKGSVMGRYSHVYLSSKFGSLFTLRY